MKYKLFAFTIALAIILGGTCRFFHINKKMQVYASTEKFYNIGDEVPLEKDFFFNIGESAEGYSITVLDTYYLPVDEFKKQYNITDNSFLEFSEYVYMIKANFKNNNSTTSENTGISINRLVLQESSFISYPDTKAFMLINEFDYAGFSLSPAQEREFIIPFGINEDYININRLNTSETRLVVSLYPNKKMINLH